MNKLIFFTFLMSIFTNNPVFINSKDFSGYIFDKNQLVLISIDNQSKRYTPSKEDIFLAENIIKKNLKCLNNDLINQGDKCPIIHKKTKKYIRQYVGFINNRNERIIWINFIWKDKLSDSQVSKDIIQVMDGCSYYWNIKVNLNTKNLNELNVNGQG
jgi:hypothetical protein